MIAALQSACRDVGFFYIAGHGIPAGLVNDLEAASREFFALDLASKAAYSMALGGRAWRGFFPVGSELTSGKPDMKEGLYLGSELPGDHPLVAAGTPLHGANLFPSEPARLRGLILSYMEAVVELGHLLVEMISCSLGLPPSYFSDHWTTDPLILFRIFNYPSDHEHVRGARRGRLIPLSDDGQWGPTPITASSPSSAKTTRAASR